MTLDYDKYYCLNIYFVCIDLNTGKLYMNIIIQLEKKHTQKNF